MNFSKKKDDDYKYQMCTYRSKENIDLFLKKINDFKKYLIDKNILFDKVEIEECILDTNENLDNKWITI